MEEIKQRKVHKIILEHLKVNKSLYIFLTICGYFIYLILPFFDAPDYYQYLEKMGEDITYEEYLDKLEKERDVKKIIQATGIITASFIVAGFIIYIINKYIN